MSRPRAQYRIQRSALVPQIGGTGDADYGRGAAGPTGAHPNLESYALSVGVSGYELDLWGRVRRLTKEALELFLASDEASIAARHPRHRVKVMNFMVRR